MAQTPKLMRGLFPEALLTLAEEFAALFQYMARAQPAKPLGQFFSDVFSVFQTCAK